MPVPRPHPAATSPASVSLYRLPTSPPRCAGPLQKPQSRFLVPESQAQPRRGPRAWESSGPRPTPPCSVPHGQAASRRAGRTPGGRRSSPGQIPPVCHPLGTSLIVSARSACPQLVLSREGGRRPSWLGRVHLPRSSYQRGGFQRRPSFRRFAWCWRGSCCSPAHRWTFTLTRSLSFAAALVHLTSVRISSGLPVPGRVFTPFTSSLCFLSHFTSPTGPLSPCLGCSLILNCLSSSLCSADLP